MKGPSGESMAAAILLLIVAVLFGFKLACAQLVYKDWTCGTPGAHCRKFVQVTERSDR